jgi:small subunit ribosomal protein S9
MEETKTKTEETSKKYFEATGRRKTSVARVRIFPSSKTSYTINDKELLEYFPTEELRLTVKDPIAKSKIAGKFKITAKILGGGVASQADAMRHGIARALVEYDMELRKKMKHLGFLKRDPRSKERRKFGLKKARKAPQWSKR